jgi:hypothetical protein
MSEVFWANFAQNAFSLTGVTPRRDASDWRKRPLVPFCLTSVRWSQTDRFAKDETTPRHKCERRFERFLSKTPVVVSCFR